MTLNGLMAVALRYFTEFGKSAFQHITASIMWRNLCTSLLYFVVRVRCRRKESSRSLSHLLMSFLLKYTSIFTLAMCCNSTSCAPIGDTVVDRTRQMHYSWCCCCFILLFKTASVACNELSCSEDSHASVSSTMQSNVATHSVNIEYRSLR